MYGYVVGVLDYVPLRRGGSAPRVR